MDEQWKRLKDDYKTNAVGCKSDYAKGSVASTRHLKRILVYLEEVTFSYYIDLRNNAVSDYSLKDALLFLTKYKLIKRIKDDCRYYYCLPFKEKIARETLKLRRDEMNLIRKERKNGN